jgi:cyclopropane-fatty-acyl-phospholipid synthase
MRLEEVIIDRYLEGRLPLPGTVVQAALNAYLKLYHRVEFLIGRQSFVPERTEEMTARARELMDTHYNMPLPMFTRVLGESMKYSMALWEHGARTLEQAQEAMLDDVFAKAEVRDGQRILDIGCGFGSLAAQALRRFPNARVYGLTLSQTQVDYMRARQAEPGHPLNTDRFYLIQGDFADAHFDQPFDRIVSLGFFEHITNIPRALHKIRSLLRDDGLCFLHYIVFRPLSWDTDAPRQDAFIDRYIFPGGRIWAHTEVGKHQAHLRLERDWYLSGFNYRDTVGAWLANFQRHFATIARESGLTPRQLRLWELYLRGCIAVFNTRGGKLYGNGQYLLRPT